MTSSAPTPSRRRLWLGVPVLVTALALGGCAAQSGSSLAGTTTSADAAASVTADETDVTQSAAEVLAANLDVHSVADVDSWNTAEETAIALSGLSATVSGDGASAEGSVVTITEPGTYRVTGALSDGQLVVTSASDGLVRIVLDGAEISSSTGAAIDVTDADSVAVILAEGSENTLSDTASYAETAEANAALYSSADLTIAGSGALTVHGNGNDGITGKDGLVIAAGALTVDAVDDGIRGKDYLVVTGGTLTVTAGGDALTSDNDTDLARGFVAISGGTATLTAEGDGISAATDTVVTGGTITVSSGGGAGASLADDVSAKGIKSGVITVIEDGTISVSAADDAVHSNLAVHISGGVLSLASGDDGIHADSALLIAGGSIDVTESEEGLEAAAIEITAGATTVRSRDDGINASGGTDTAESAEADAAQPQPGGPGEESGGSQSVLISGGSLVIDADGDGLDSNGTAEITGGTVVVHGPTGNGNGALDVDGSFTVSGGVLLAAGSTGMVVSPDTDSAQGWISGTLDSSQPAGTTVQVLDADGTVLATFAGEKAFQSVVFSSAAITTGETYTLAVGGSAVGTVIGGLATDGDASGATTSATAVAGQAAAGGGGGGPR